MQADLGTLKATLLELPALGQSSASAMYSKLVAKEVAPAEHLLKLVQTPEELLEETVAEMDRTGVKIDLGKILELKGLKKADTERIIEAYNMMHSSASEGGKKIKKLFNLGA
jgi:DNA polymerase I-like protein with 3'-5' exonuclease and polymerase domains